MRIIVTGALGHIGSALIRFLPRSILDSELILIDNLHTQRYCSLFGIQARFIEADARHCKLPDHDMVVHLAAYTEPHNPDIDWNHNFDATTNIIKQTKRIIFPSTISVLPEPQTSYAQVKREEEDLLWFWEQKQAKQVTILRLGNIFGPSPGMRFHTVVSKLCWQAFTGQKLSVWKSALQQRRPYLDVIDVCRAISFLIKNDKPGVYNLSTQTAILDDVINSIQKRIKAEVELLDTPSMNDIQQDIDTKPIEALGFKFIGNLDSGIAGTLALLRGRYHDSSSQSAG